MKPSSPSAHRSDLRAELRSPWARSGSAAARWCIAACAAAVISGCGSAPLRYVDPDGKEYSGNLNATTNTMTAQIDKRLYRGSFTVDLWGQSRAILTAADNEKLYCKFAYRVRDVVGTCTTPMGRSYDFTGRQ